MNELIDRINSFVQKSRIYLKQGEKPPKGVQVMRGKRGGMYYEASRTPHSTPYGLAGKRSVSSKPRKTATVGPSQRYRADTEDKSLRIFADSLIESAEERLVETYGNDYPADESQLFDDFLDNLPEDVDLIAREAGVSTRKLVDYVHQAADKRAKELVLMANEAESRTPGNIKITSDKALKTVSKYNMWGNASDKNKLVNFINSPEPAGGGYALEKLFGKDRHIAFAQGLKAVGPVLKRAGMEKHADEISDYYANNYKGLY